MQVTIEKLDHFGRGIAYTDKICFVENALPGEIVDIKVTKNTKKYLEAEVTNYIEQSKNRVKEVCPYIKDCGGCSLEHLSFTAENKYKQEKVAELVEKFAGLDKKLVEETTSTEEYFYRNKITLHGNNNKLGYYKKKSNDLLSITYCHLVTPKINELLKDLSKLANTNNLKETVIRTSNDESKVMIKLSGNITDYQDILSKVDVLVINDKPITKDDKITSTIGSKRYYLSIDSFFQVNKTLTEKLYNEVKQVVQTIKPKRVLDLYCGTGTIGLYIADEVEEVIGIDYSKEGIKNANQNKLLNNSNNTTFICNKVENVIDTFENNFDLIVVDPPRAGLDPKTINNIKRIAPTSIVYISCDPVTLARDLKELKTSYNIETIKPYNMFPRTHHVESVAVLYQKNIEKLGVPIENKRYIINEKL